MNNGRETMEIEAGGNTLRKAAAREKAGRAKEMLFKDKAEKRNN